MLHAMFRQLPAVILLTVIPALAPAQTVTWMGLAAQTEAGSGTVRNDAPPAATTAPAGDVAVPPARAATLAVQGTGVVSAAPDIVTITVGVEVGAPTADQAMRRNADRMRAIMDLLKARKVAPGDIQTSQFSLQPIWENRAKPYDKPLSIIGFNAINTVRVTLRRIDMLGAVLDGLSQSGANRIQNVRFDIADARPLRDEARRRAVRDAMRKARLYADAAGRRLGPILSISEPGTTSGGTVELAMAARAPGAIPIAEGRVALRARVIMRFALQ